MASAFGRTFRRVRGVAGCSAGLTTGMLQLLGDLLLKGTTRPVQQATKAELPPLLLRKSPSVLGTGPSGRSEGRLASRSRSAIGSGGHQVQLSDHRPSWRRTISSSSAAVDARQPLPGRGVEDLPRAEDARQPAWVMHARWLSAVLHQYPDRGGLVRMPLTRVGLHGGRKLTRGWMSSVYLPVDEPAGVDASRLSIPQVGDSSSHTCVCARGDGRAGGAVAAPQIAAPTGRTALPAMPLTRPAAEQYQASRAVTMPT